MNNTYMHDMLPENRDLVRVPVMVGEPSSRRIDISPVSLHDHRLSRS